MDDFALRIRQVVIDESMRRSSEICGEFRQERESLVLELYTIGHLRHCSYRRVAAHAYTGLTYHTHILIGITDSHRRTAKLMSPQFSEEDYSHPGYLATERKVLFQSGRGTERWVGRGPRVDELSTITMSRSGKINADKD